MYFWPLCFSLAKLYRYIKHFGKHLFFILTSIWSKLYCAVQVCGSLNPHMRKFLYTLSYTNSKLFCDSAAQKCKLSTYYWVMTSSSSPLNVLGHSSTVSAVHRWSRGACMCKAWDESDQMEEWFICTEPTLTHSSCANFRSTSGSEERARQNAVRQGSVDTKENSICN